MEFFFFSFHLKKVMEFFIKINGEIWHIFLFKN